MIFPQNIPTYKILSLTSQNKNKNVFLEAKFTKIHSHRSITRLKLINKVLLGIKLNQSISHCHANLPNLFLKKFQLKSWACYHGNAEMRKRNGSHAANIGWCRQYPQHFAFFRVAHERVTENDNCLIDGKKTQSNCGFFQLHNFPAFQPTLPQYTNWALSCGYDNFKVI